MQRYFLELCYLGSDFCGWQKQPNGVSVQETIEIELTKLNANQPIEVVGCGRTDAGVHASQYFLHFDMEHEVDIQNWLYKLNKMLPKTIAIINAFQVEEGIHARFSATKRTYRYFIHDTKKPFISHQSWYFPLSLDLQKMNEAASILLGTHDFTSFAKLHTDAKTNICEVFSAEWHKDDNGIFFEISANRFLRNMVRSTVGTLLEVGMGKQAPSYVLNVLNAKNRNEAAVSVPAHGLFLWQINYPF
jgi:tRNA pseudouridine38-40 synthase